MLGDHEVEFDESTSSAGPYFLEGMVVRIERSLYRVASTRRIKGTRKRAWLDLLDTPSDDDRAAANEWSWDMEAQRMRWMPVE